jgi:site-specific recombinase XerD
MMASRLTLRAQVSPRDTMAAAVESFYQRCRARNLSPGTIQFYAYRFLAFNRFLDEKELHLAPADVTASVVRDFLTWEQQRSSAVTAKHS